MQFRKVNRVSKRVTAMQNSHLFFVKPSDAIMQVHFLVAELFAKVVIKKTEDLNWLSFEGKIYNPLTDEVRSWYEINEVLADQNLMEDFKYRKIEPTSNLEFRNGQWVCYASEGQKTALKFIMDLVYIEQAIRL